MIFHGEFGKHRCQPKPGGWRGTDLLVSMDRLTSVGHLLGKDTVISLYYVILSHYSPLITIILVL